MCFDGVKRLCHIRGKLRKKVWINQSDIILVGLRDYQDARADVILKYSPEEARNLKSAEQLNAYCEHMLPVGWSAASSGPAPKLSKATISGFSLDSNIPYVGAHVSVQPSKFLNLLESMQVSKASVFPK